MAENIFLISREVIASVVGSDQEKYSEAFLGRSNSDYTRWIQTKEAWGGAIEVQILSEYFQVEIVVVDTMSGSFTRFGESLNFSTRMVLIYDGIHYDALYSVGPGGTEMTVHPTTDLRSASNTLCRSASACGNCLFQHFGQGKGHSKGGKGGA